MPRKSRNNWTEQEESLLCSLVNELGLTSWSIIAVKISESFQTRSGKQCRERWHGYLNPSIKKEAWSIPEQNLVFKCIKKHGYHWSMISKKIPGRTENMIKNYFYSTIRKNMRRLTKKLVLLKKFKGTTQELLENPILKEVIFCNSEKSAKMAKKLAEMLIETGRNLENYEKVPVAEKVGNLESNGQMPLTDEVLNFDPRYSQWINYWVMVRSIIQNLDLAAAEQV